MTAPLQKPLFGCLYASTYGLNWTLTVNSTAISIAVSFPTVDSFTSIYFIPTILYALLRMENKGLFWWLSGKESACQSRRPGFNLWSRKISHATEQLSPWATTIEPVLQTPRSTLLRPAWPRACALQWKKPPWREACALQLESSPCFPQLEKRLRSSKDPAQPELNKIFKKSYLFKKKREKKKNVWKINNHIASSLRLIACVKLIMIIFSETHPSFMSAINVDYITQSSQHPYTIVTILQMRKLQLQKIVPLVQSHT